MSARRLAVACALAATACGPSGAKLATMPNAKPIADAVVHALCTGDMGGDAASIQVWRQKDGTFVTLELRPDVAKHGANAPTTFFDDGGREVMRLDLHPVSPSSPEALEADRRRESVTLDGRKAEIIACKGK